MQICKICIRFSTPYNPSILPELGRYYILLGRNVNHPITLTKGISPLIPPSHKTNDNRN